jgi:hypothetical protein
MASRQDHKVEHQKEEGHVLHGVPPAWASCDDYNTTKAVGFQRRAHLFSYSSNARWVAKAFGSGVFIRRLIEQSRDNVHHGKNSDEGAANDSEKQNISFVIPDTRFLEHKLDPESSLQMDPRFRGDDACGRASGKLPGLIKTSIRKRHGGPNAKRPEESGTEELRQT